jgi:hypothetical protein
MVVNLKVNGMNVIGMVIPLSFIHTAVSFVSIYCNNNKNSNDTVAIMMMSYVLLVVMYSLSAALFR